MKKIMLICLMVLFLSVSMLSLAKDEIGKAVSSNSQEEIDFTSICKVVSNSNSKQIFVPTGFASEWTGTKGFISNLPAGVTLDECSRGNNLDMGNQVSCNVIDKELMCWGYNSWGALGTENYVHEATPKKVEGISDVISVQSTETNIGHSCALKSNGNIMCWGYRVSTPQELSGISNIKSISKMGWLLCGVDSSARGKCWYLSGNSNTITASGIMDFGYSDVKQIEAGTDKTCALLNNGQMYCREINNINGNTKTFGWTSATRVGSHSDITQITVGNGHQCYVRSNNEGYCIGSGYSGQLGNGEKVQQTSPVKILLNNIEMIDAGSWYATCAITTDGKGYCWGDGALVTTSGTSNVATPIYIGLSDLNDISTGHQHACASTESGDIYCWGDDTTSGIYGELGNGATGPSSTPIKVNQNELEHDCKFTGTCTTDTPSIGQYWKGGTYLGKYTTMHETDEGFYDELDFVLAPKSTWTYSMNIVPNGYTKDATHAVNAYNLLSDGEANTRKFQQISSAYKTQPDADPYNAFDYCDNLVVNGYDDWYLPSLREMGWAYRNKGTIDLFSSGTINSFMTSTRTATSAGALGNRIVYFCTIRDNGEDYLDKSYYYPYNLNQHCEQMQYFSEYLVGAGSQYIACMRKETDWSAPTAQENEPSLNYGVCTSNCGPYKYWRFEFPGDRARCLNKYEWGSVHETKYKIGGVWYKGSATSDTSGHINGVGITSITASSTFTDWGPGYAPHKAFDQDLQTYWSAGTRFSEDSFLQLELTGTMDPTAIKIGSFRQSADMVVLYGSNDKFNWDKLGMCYPSGTDNYGTNLCTGSCVINIP